MAEAKFTTIKRFIIQQIESRLWSENTKVPSENELAAQFDVSRMTARRALQDLTEQGVLTRTQGLGTFVASLKSHSSVMEIRNIADEINSRGHHYYCHVHTLKAITAAEPENIALELAKGETIFYSLLSHCENDIPLQLEERFVNPAIASDYLQQDFSQLTPHEYLSQRAPLTQARHTIEAIAPSKIAIDLLQLETNEPCLLITRRTWSKQGVVSFARLTYPGSRYRLDSHLMFEPSNPV